MSKKYDAIIVGSGASGGAVAYMLCKAGFKVALLEKGKFLNYNTGQKENALRAYEEDSTGEGWLDRIMILSLEGLLSDPIYGGNFGESGWRSLHTRGGDPRPKTRYIEL